MVAVLRDAIADDRRNFGPASGQRLIYESRAEIAIRLGHELRVAGVAGVEGVAGGAGGAGGAGFFAGPGRGPGLLSGLTAFHD